MLHNYSKHNSWVLSFIIKANHTKLLCYLHPYKIYLVPRCRKVVVFLLEGVDSLKAHMQLSWTVELGKVCHHELWFSHGGRDGFLHRKDIQADNVVALVL